MKWLCQSKSIRHESKKLGILSLLAGALFLVSHCVQAACPVVDNMTSVPELNMDPTLPVGAVLASTTVMWKSDNGSCTLYAYPSQPIYGTGAGTLIDASKKLYATTIPGVAYRTSWGGMATPYSYNTNTSQTSTWGPGPILIEFIKTGPVGAGTFGPQNLITETFGGQQFWVLNLATSIVIKPAAPACTVTNSAITETLADVSQATLNAVGKTAGDKTINIPLNCATATNISLIFSGNMADAANGVFKSTDAATANSVGIQLLDRNGTAIPTTPNSYVPVGSVTGAINYPMTARYYALSSTVPAGNVSAIAFATVVYN